MDAMRSRSKHKCLAKGCEAQLPASRLMCLDHWRLVPREIQDRIWQHYQRGQTLRTASPEWVSAAKDAVRAVAAAEKGAA